MGQISSAPSRSATLRDVAELSGVSVSTVSRVLNDVANAASPVTIERIMSAVRTLSYVPNMQAAGLRKQAPGAVGFIVPDISNPFFAGIALTLEHSLLERGQGLLLANTGNSTDLERKYVRMMSEKRVAALIVAPTSDKKDHLEAIRKLGIRLVLIDSRVTGLDVDCVLVDDHAAVERAVSYLTRLGHTRIGYISGHLRIKADVDRMEGWQSAVAKAGLENRPELTSPGDFTVSGGYQAAARLWALDDPPTAIVAANNFMAIGVLRWAQTNDVKIPQQLSLISFDDMDWFDLVEPGLTAIRQPVQEIGNLISDLLGGVSDGGASVPYVLPTQMVVRGSTASPAPSRI